ncbi:MAG: threonine--tRNA ligase [Rickettsiales bacterium]|jgi:threonyl-tRNA synthetase|nr:threonine--tRNA ligase [Rickettsiales bacterium]
MLKIKYLDRVHEVEDGINGFKLVKLLNNELSKAVVAIRINDEIFDLSATIGTNSTVELITGDMVTGLEIIRHSTAHLLAYAVQELYGEDVKFAIGPSIDNGFYYDFDVATPFSENDFEKIEEKMLELIKGDEKFSKEIWSRAEALKYFKDKKEIYKVELISGLDENETISIYKVGNFVDLCRGTHVPSTRYLKNFKLTKVAGAYWRGNSDNKMLQRIYGIAFDTPEKLKEYLIWQEEAEKRDHRKICKAMDILHFEPEYAPGAAFMHPKGLYMYNKLIGYMREKQDKTGYVEVSTPRVMDRVLWEISGHWEKYGEHNYSGQTEDGKQFCLKPMNCPGGILIYKQGMKSYRDLPLKISEFGKVNRYEASGALLGLLRVREFTQDDAHIFCTPEQVQDQCVELMRFLLDVYKDFGFRDVKIKLSTRPPNRIGSEQIWDLSEKALADALKKMGLNYTVFDGEGAFYGPKLEFVLYDSIGRDWQMGTIQLDMNLPARFGITYIAEDGQKHEPVMLHRAIFGSIERFIGIFIENTEGKFPLWINPLPVGIATITEDSGDYAEYVRDRLVNEDLRVKLDTSNETIGHKIREMSLEKIPYILTIGKKEKSSNTLNVRILGEQDTVDLPVDKFIEAIKLKIKLKESSYTF